MSDRAQSDELEGAVESLANAARAEPSNARLQHKLGNAYQDQGKLDRAIATYRRALRADPSLAEVWNDIGTAYFAKGFLADAERNFREATRLDPAHGVAHANLGATLRRQGRINEARRAYQRALWMKVRGWFGKPALAPEPPSPPTPEEALESIRRLRASGEHWHALAQAEQLVDGHPLHRPAVLELASILAEQRKFASAIELYSRAITLKPDDAQAQLALGKTYLGLGAPGEAARCLRNAARLEPGLVDAHLKLGFTLITLGHPKDAEAAFRAAEQMAPDDIDRKLGLAIALRDTGRTEEAIAMVQSIDFSVEANADTLNRAGLMLTTDSETMDEGIKLLERARDAATNPAPPLINLCLALQQKGDLEAALRCARIAQRHEPWSPAANFNESVVLLLSGDFARGWDKYHWRTRLGGHKFNYPKFPKRRLWDGSPLTGRSIFLHGEQGLGDEIMFASCLDEAIAQTGRCVLGCDKRLEPLFRRSFPRAEVVGALPSERIGWERTAPLTELYAPLGDLPGFYRRKPEDFPDHGGYLRADPQKVASWRERLAAIDARPKVGISWRGGAVATWRRRRSTTLETLLPILQSGVATFVNLQYGDRASELESLLTLHGIHVHDFPEAIDDLDQTAALCCALDLTVSICTSIVHMNGALGRPVWVMAPQVPEWRYGIRGETLPWYPSVRVYRQAEADDWSALVERVRGDLAARFAELTSTARAR